MSIEEHHAKRKTSTGSGNIRVHSIALHDLVAGRPESLFSRTALNIDRANLK